MVEAFGKYLLLEKLASGGMAEVYLAKSIGANGINKFLAIKRILPQYSDNPEFIEMFKEEAKIAVNLNHGNVVSIFDFGVERSQFYLVMEYVEGQNMRQVLNHMKKENKDFSLDQIVYLIKEVASGLDHAHRCLDGATGRPLNITHRDMSPQNVMLSFEGEIKVVDFGIAKAENQMEHTRAGTIKGKFGYMSPEQADGQSVDLRTDIFSLGIVLWELLAKDRLFVAQSEAATLRRVRECQIPSLRKINPNIPPELERICNKALAKDRSLRYQTSAAFHKDLNRFLNVQYPEFSTQEFSKFMKSLYNKMYVENRKKFAEYAKLQIEEEKTAVTQTATATVTATDTAPHLANSFPPPAAQVNHVAMPPPSLNSVPMPPGRAGAIIAPPPADQVSEDEPLQLEVPENSKVDVQNLRLQDRPETSPRLAAQLKEASRTTPGGSYSRPGTHPGTFPGTHPGLPTGTQSRITARPFPSEKKKGLPPGAIAGGVFVLVALAFVFFQGPGALLDGKPFAQLKGIFAGAPSGVINESSTDAGATTTTSPSANDSTSDTKDSKFVEQVPLAIHSQPTGATVYVNGQNRGFTPYRGWIELNKNFRITLVKEEYLPYDRGEMKAASAEGVTIRATLQPEPPTGYIGVDVINGGGEPVISVNGVRLAEKPPIQRYPVPAGVPVKIRVYNPLTQLYAEETVIVGVGQRRAVRLILGRTGQTQ
ncbi:MAG: protein kinase [Bdellovibrionaceae bacterium]|nr:protein kinase [Pseudobdellovibrionaceae bacterium]